MAIICPMLSNKKVALKFNELKNIVGQRAAYDIWSKNNGNSIEYAPNGARSMLFDRLLSKYNGNRKKAIIAKAKMFGKRFRQLFGDWTHDDSPKVKYYGPTMGKTTAAKNNERLVDFDDIVRDKLKEAAQQANMAVRQYKKLGSEEYKKILLDAINEWRSDINNYGKTLMVSNMVLSNENIFDNFPKIPSKRVFIERQVSRGESSRKEAAEYYDDIIRNNPNLMIENRFVSDIENDYSNKIGPLDKNGEPAVFYDLDAIKNVDLEQKSIREINILSAGPKSFILKEIANSGVGKNDILKIAQSSKKKWIEAKQKQILDDTQMRLVDAYGLVKLVDKDGKIRFVSELKDEKYQLIIDFLEYISDDTQGYYDYNSKSAAAHHTIAISLTNGDPSTFSHELAHHYIRMFWNSKLVLTALRAVDKPGITDEEREEALVDIITAKTNDQKTFSIIESPTFVQKFWGALANMLYTTFNIENQAIRDAIYQNVTKAFILNEELQVLSSENYVFAMANTRMFKKSFAKKIQLVYKKYTIQKTYEQRKKAAQQLFRANRSVVDYEKVGGNKLFDAIYSIIEGTISRNKLYRRNTVENLKTLILMQLSEDAVRKFMEDIKQYRKTYLQRLNITTEPTPELKIDSTLTPREKSANIKLIKSFLEHAEMELLELSKKFTSMKGLEYSQYIKRENTDPNTGETTIEYIESGLEEDSDEFIPITFLELCEIQQNVIGFYERALDDLYKAVRQDEFKNQYGELLQKEILSIVSLEQQDENNLFVSLKIPLEQISACYQDAITKNLRNFVIDYVYQHCTDLDDYQKQKLIYSTNTWLENQNAFGDIGALETFFGLATNSKSSLIRLMLDIVENILVKMNDESNLKGNQLRELRKKAMTAASKEFLDGKVYGFLSPFNLDKLLMEKDDYDEFTGNFITPVNDGAFYKNRMRFINDLLYNRKNGIQKKLRDASGDKYFELEIDEKGNPIFPEGFDDIEREYLHAINKWTGKHAVRRFTVEYYDKRIDMLSSMTRKALSEIDNDIHSIVGACTFDGIVRTDLLTKSQLLNLRTLYYRRQQLSNPFDLYGREKPDGSDQAKIAKELIEWNKWLSEHIKYKFDTNSYNIAKSNAKDKDLFEKFNTYTEINPELWEEVSKLFPNPTPQLLEKIEKLRFYRNKLKSIIKEKGLVFPKLSEVVNLETGEIIPGYEEFWKNLLLYDQMLYSLRPNNNNKVAKKAYAAIMKSSPVVIDLPGGVKETAFFHINAAITNRIKLKYNGVLDPNAKKEIADELSKFLMIIKSRNGHISKVSPLSIFSITKPVAKNVQTSKGLIPSIVKQPISAYSVIDEENSNPEYVDLRYDATNDKAMLPLTDDTVRNKDDVSYTNHKYKKFIENGPQELKDYYNALIETMGQSYLNIPFAGTYDNRLPQKGATSRQMRHRNNWWRIDKHINYWAKRTFGINESDVDINVDYEVRPDGKRSMNIPVRYLSRLENSAEINSDILGNVIQFYEMSLNYKFKSEALPIFLTAIDKLENTKSKNRPRQTTMLKGIVNRQFYERSRTIEFNENNEMSYGESLKKIALKYIPGLRGLTTLGLLAGNWLAGTVAYLDPAILIAVDAASGKYIDWTNFIKGMLLVIIRLPLALASAGKSKSYDKISSGLTWAGLAKSGQYNFKDMDKSQIHKVLTDGFLMLPFSLGEHTVNAHVFASIMDSYKYVEDAGSFMNKKEYYKWADDHGIPLMKAKLKYMVLPTLLDAYHTDKQGNFVRKNNKYGNAVTELLELRVKKKMKDRAKNSNYIVPSTERTKMLSNIIAAFAVVMRTFMLVGIGERVKVQRDFQIEDESQINDATSSKPRKYLKNKYYENIGGYNFSTGEIENGIWHGALRAIAHFPRHLQYLWYSLTHPFRSRYSDATQKFMESKKISETDVYAVNRIIAELAVILICAIAQTVFHNKMIDDGDDDKYWYQVIDHLLIRLTLVRLTWFHVDTVFDIINTITPSKSDIDKKLKLIDLLIDTYQGFKEHGDQYEQWEKITSGAYKDKPKAMRDLFQTFSSIGLHNIYTSSTIGGIKTKTKWYNSIVSGVPYWKSYWHDKNDSNTKNSSVGFNINSLNLPSKVNIPGEFNLNKVVLPPGY